jgi:quinol monooxygenase YgiN
MRNLSLLLLSGALMLAASIQPAQAQAPGSPSVYVVTYFEVAPASARQAAGLLRQFAAATRKEDGNFELTALHEIGRPGRFAMVEAWRDKAALDAHGAAMKALGDKTAAAVLKPVRSANFPAARRRRAANGRRSKQCRLRADPCRRIPSRQGRYAAMIKQLAEDSPKDAGSQRFDAVIQDGRPNHFHLIEAWADRKSREAHAAADHTKAFRAKLVPFEGALYDERLYEVVK